MENFPKPELRKNQLNKSGLTPKNEFLSLVAQQSEAKELKRRIFRDA